MSQEGIVQARASPKREAGLTEWFMAVFVESAFAEATADNLRLLLTELGGLPTEARSPLR